MIRTRHHRAAAVADGDTVTVCLVPWDTPAQVTDNGRDYYAESFARGGLDVPDRLLGEVEHNGAVVGRAVTAESRDDGLYADVRISHSTAGRDFLADVDAGIYEAVSIDFDDDPTPVAAGGEIVRSSARLNRFAFTTSPQHPGARLVGRRSTPQETDNMDTDTPDTDPADTVADEPVAEAVTSTRSTPREAPAPRPTGGARTGARFRSLGEFTLAAARGDVDGDELARYQRALATTTTADQTGLVHETWIAEVVDMVRNLTPTVESFATRPLPEDGNSIEQPKVTQRATAGKQAAEGNEPASQAVEITPISFGVDTYTGGQNMSIQTILRSSPSYLNEVMRLHIEAMASAVNTAALTAVLAAVPGSGPGNLHKIDATADFHDDVIDACAVILADLNRFPEFILVSPTKWATIAKEKDSDGRPIYSGVNPVNAAGAASATLGGNVASLPFRVEPGLSGTIDAVVAVAEAFRTFRSGVQTLTADVPSTLGRDVAVFQFAAMGAVDANGLATIDATP